MEGVEWMQVFVLGRRVHPYIDRAQFSRCSITFSQYRIEARHETRCEEATSTSLHSKKKEARKIEPAQINNECIEKALIQLTGVVKCILVVLVFFGLAFLVKIVVGVHAKRRSVWGRALELALQVGPQLRKPTIGKPPPRPPRDG